MMPLCLERGADADVVNTIKTFRYLLMNDHLFVQGIFDLEASVFRAHGRR